MSTSELPSKRCLKAALEAERCYAAAQQRLLYDIWLRTETAAPHETQLQGTPPPDEASDLERFVISPVMRAAAGRAIRSWRNGQTDGIREILSTATLESARAELPIPCWVSLSSGGAPARRTSMRAGHASSGPTRIAVAWRCETLIAAAGGVKDDPPESSDFLEQVGQALHMLRATSNDAAEVVRQTVNLIVPLPAVPGAHNSFTAWDCPGVIFIGPSADPIHLAEAILHEACHNVLNYMSRFSSLVTTANRGVLYPSPWKTAPRPIEGVVHGAFVFANVIAFQAQLLREQPQNEQARAKGRAQLQRRHRLNSSRLAEAVSLLRAVELSPLSEAVRSMCEETMVSDQAR